MHELALVQHLFRRVWLPKMPSSLARLDTLVPREFISVSSGDVSESSTPIATLPNKSKATPKRKPVASQVQAKKTQPVREKERLAVPMPVKYSICAQLIAPDWGMVVPLSVGQAGLVPDDYVMLTKLVNAFRGLLDLAPIQVEFEFFHWPPRLASSFDVEVVGLHAFKGFLHQIASRRHVSWLVFDTEFARACFQSPELSPFQTISRNNSILFAGPSISELGSNAQLKKELWLSLKRLIQQS